MEWLANVPGGPLGVLGVTFMLLWLVPNYFKDKREYPERLAAWEAEQANRKSKGK